MENPVNHTNHRADQHRAHRAGAESDGIANHRDISYQSVESLSATPSPTTQGPDRELEIIQKLGQFAQSGPAGVTLTIREITPEKTIEYTVTSNAKTGLH